MCSRLEGCGVTLQECNLSCSEMELKVWLVRKHLSHLRMQLNILFTKSCIHLCKFIVLSAVAALAVSLSQRQNGKSCDGSEEERARSLARKQRRRQSINAASMPWSLGRERWVRERAAAPSEANKARGCLDKRMSSHSVRFKNARAFLPNTDEWSHQMKY